MTKRTLSFVSLGVTAALLISERMAYSSETIRELLSPPDATPHSITPPSAVPQSDSVKPSTITPPSNTPLTVPQAVQSAQPDIDPKTGKPRVVTVKKKHKGLFGFFDSMGESFRRLGKQLHSEVQITGNKSVGVHLENVSGNASAYQSTTNYGVRSLGGAYDQTDLTVHAKLLGVFNFATQYSNSGYRSPNSNQYSLNYAGQHLKLDAGDITGSITGNSLISFSRTLQGVQVSTDLLHGFRLTGLLSETSATPRTVTINGGNGPGPYYVYAGQIVDGSVHVRVNNQDETIGKDYTIDLTTGELMFSAGTIIHELDVITVSFETYGQQTAGLLTGLRAEMSLIKTAKMGFTYLSESTPQNSGAPSARTEKFYGQLTPPYRYFLVYPVAVTTGKDKNGNTIVQPQYPMTVTVDGIAQVYGVNYAVDTLVPNQIDFASALLSTQTVSITYVPDLGNQIPGNRKVIGADTSVSLGKTGSVTAELAQSNYQLSGNGVNGDAWQLRSDLKFLQDKLHLTCNLHNVGSDFAPIESTGFQLNDRGLDLGFDYAVAPSIKLTATMDHDLRPSYDYSSSVASTGGIAKVDGYDNYSLMNLGLTWQMGKHGQFGLTHNSSTTDLFGGGKNAFSSDNLTLGYALKTLSFDVALGRDSNLANSVSTTTGSSSTPSEYGSNDLTSRLNMRWRPSDRFSLSAVASNSQGTTLTGQGDNAQDMQLTAEIVPIRSMQLTLGLQNQNSGSYSFFSNSTGTTTGTTTGSTSGSTTGSTTGTATTNNGLSSGDPFNNPYNSYGANNFAGKTKSLTAGLSYQPRPSLHLDLHWNNSTSIGSYLYNSQLNNIDGAITYNAGQKLSITSTFAHQSVNYIGSTGGTGSNLISFNVLSKLLGKLSSNFSYQILRTTSNLPTNTTGSNNGTTLGTYGNFGSTGSGSNSTVFGTGGMNLNGLNVNLEYPIWRGNNLFFQYQNSSSTGYLASIQHLLSFGINFNLANNMVFSLGWRSQNQTSLGTTSTDSANYRVNSLDANLNMHF